MNFSREKSNVGFIIHEKKEKKGCILNFTWSKPMLSPQIELAYISSQSSETYVISCISLVIWKSKEC